MSSPEPPALSPASSISPRQLLADAQCVVIKCGTQILMGEDGQLQKPRLTQIVHECAQWHRQGKQLLMVTSGAVGLGQKTLGLKGALALDQKQACAAVGQSQLMEIYRQLFDCHGIVTAQVLVTARDIADRRHYLTLQKTLKTLLEMNVIPIINENDTISDAELLPTAATQSFGDNDKLSAILASKINADVLILLTTVDGIYTDNPQHNPDADRLAVIEGFEALQDVSVSGQSALGRGGMATKIEAARIAALSGVHTVISSGVEPQPLLRLLDVPSVGTFVVARASLQSRKRWLGFASGTMGALTINSGAARALVHQQASLLAAGVTAVAGQFGPRQVVSIQTDQGDEIGRGLCHYSAEQMAKIVGRQSHEFDGLLGLTNAPAEVIHRDQLVLYDALYQSPDA
ncbi:MAG: glutamate 5-kinase [Cyanobacteria bacterium HKST-UBA05]|nr:glutamate 5-kinase [Cyanobacteria bacterium HKST-UBA05]